MTETEVSILKVELQKRTKESLETGKEIVFHILEQNREYQFTVQEIIEIVDCQIGRNLIREVLNLFSSEGKTIKRRYASNRCTYQLR